MCGWKNLLCTYPRYRSYLFANTTTAKKLKKIKKIKIIIPPLSNGVTIPIVWGYARRGLLCCPEPDAAVFDNTMRTMGSINVYTPVSRYLSKVVKFKLLYYFSTTDM